MVREYTLNGTTYDADELQLVGIEDGYYEVQLLDGTVVETSTTPMDEIPITTPIPPPVLDSPIGTIVASARATAPTGWALCDGASLLRVDYPDLFDAIGTAYGAVDGTHFTLPDLRQRFPMGKAVSGTGATLGSSGGTIDHIHDAHTTASVGILGALTSAHTGPTTHAASNPPFQVVTYQIKVL